MLYGAYPWRLGGITIGVNDFTGYGDFLAGGFLGAGYGGKSEFIKSSTIPSIFFPKI
jgi:hypothetical protein